MVDCDTAPVGRQDGVTLGHLALRRQGRFHRRQHRRELDQRAIASGFNDMAASVEDERIDGVAVRLQGRQSAVLILSHYARIAGTIGAHDRRHPALSALHHEGSVAVGVR